MREIKTGVEPRFFSENLGSTPVFVSGGAPTIYDQQNGNLATNHLVDDPVGLEVDLSMGLDT